MNKNDAHVDFWLKDIAPSTDLRRCFGHDPNKWDEFRQRYRDELKNNAMAVDTLNELIGKSVATLLYGAKDSEHNNAVVLMDFIGDR